MKAENILTSLSKIKTAIANDNSENPQAPANLTDALSGIAGAITEQKGSSSGGAATGGGRVIEIKQNPNDSNDWSLTSPITWSEIEQLIYNKVPISLVITHFYQNSFKTLPETTNWESFTISQYKIISIQKENLKHIITIQAVKVIQDTPRTITINVGLYPSININAESFQQCITDFNNVNVSCQMTIQTLS